MKRIIKLSISVIALVLCYSQTVFAQLESINYGGVSRTFIVHTPLGYTRTVAYPIVLNMHGLNSNATEQMAYSEFNSVSDTGKFIVIYPNAINGQWALANNTDVDFLSALVDTMRRRYSTNACLFATGMSMGGFMSYKLACSLSAKITAIAPVTGNMATIQQTTCVLTKAIPVLHFHGTTDPIVDYNGSLGIPSVETTVNWWATKNNCATTPSQTNLPDITTSDNSTATKIQYNACRNGAEVSLYKINGGGHTWPGATIPLPAFGNTNKDIKASALIWQFFSRFCTAATPTHEVQNWAIALSPNPVTGKLVIRFGEAQNTEGVLRVYNLLGQIVKTKTVDSSQTVYELDTADLPIGTYFLGVKFLSFSSKTLKFIKL